MGTTGHIFSFIFNTFQENHHLHGSQELTVTVISAWYLRKKLQSAVNIHLYSVNPKTLLSRLRMHSGRESFKNSLCDLYASECAYLETSESDCSNQCERKKERKLKDKGVNQRCIHTYKKCWWVCIVYPFSMVTRNKAILLYFFLIYKQPYEQHRTSLTARLLLMQDKAESETHILSSL